MQPREFSGRLIHQLPVPHAPLGEVYLELYLSEPKQEPQVGLYRSGTRVLESLTELEAFQHPPWTDCCLEGIVNAPFLNLTPGTRTGIVRDRAFSEFCAAMEPVTATLKGLVEEQRRAEDDRASRQMLRTIQKAFREALLSLPPEDYDWFDVQARGSDARSRANLGADGMIRPGASLESERDTPPEKGQKAFFDYSGPLFSVRISPSSCVVPVGESRTLRAIARDRSRRLVEHDLKFAWHVAEGGGSLENVGDEIVKFSAPSEPGLTRLCVTVTQGPTTCDAESLLTVTESLLPDTKGSSADQQGLPGYAFKRAPGELWRARYDNEQNFIVINNGHRDFVFASRNRALKLATSHDCLPRNSSAKIFPVTRRASFSSA